MTRKTLSLVAAVILSLPSFSQKSELKATLVDAVHFPATVPPGDYSGICWLGGNEYAVVSDKSRSDGFFIFHIDIDPSDGHITAVSSNEFRTADRPNRDQEGIAYFPADTTIFISGEADNKILEYRLDTGKRTGRSLDLPDDLAVSAPNYGYESLTYSPVTHTFWTTSESTLPIDGQPASPRNKVRNKLRLLAFDDSLRFVKEYPYEMDAPEVKSSSADRYAMGVSELCALDDGRLLVLEREFFVPTLKIGAFVNCKIFVVDPTDDLYSTSLHKKLLTQFKTRLTGLKTNIANYEGMCLGPKLNDGRQVLVLVSDSQSQYKKVLKDWFRTIIIGG